MHISERRNNAPARRVVGAAALAAAITLFAGVMLDQARQGRGYDLIPIATAGRLAAAGAIDHIYAHDDRAYNRVDDSLFRETASSVGFDDPTPFVYPPLVAVALRPAAHVNFDGLRWFWSVASVGLVLCGVWMTLCIYLPGWLNPLRFAMIVVALSAFVPLRYGFWLGQTTAVIFPLVVGAILLQRKGRLSAAGLALAIAAFVKLTPIVLTAVWIWRGPRRAAYWCVAWLAVFWAASLALAGVAVHATYFSRVREIGRTLVVAYNNHALTAFLGRLQLPRAEWNDWRLHDPSVPLTVLAFAVLLGLVGISAAVVNRRRTAENGRAALEAVAILLMLLAPNIAWTHYFVFLLPVMAIVWSIGGSRFSAAAIAAAFIMCCWPLLPTQEGADLTRGAIAIGAPTLAALILWCSLIVLIYSPERASVGDRPVSIGST